MSDVMDPAPEDTPVIEAGRGRRHRPSDLWHERTNFRFIERSWRWALLSGVLILVSVVSLATRGVNLGIEFDGGTAWLVPVPTFEPDIDDVRDVLSAAGVNDAKVSILDPSGSDDAHQIRVQTELLDDPVSGARAVLATTANVTRADVVFRQSTDGSATWTATPLVEVDDGVLEQEVQAIEGLGAATVERDGDRVVVAVAELPPSPVTAVSAALADFAEVDSGEVSVDTVGPTWGERVTRKAIQALVIFFALVVLYLSWRFEWKMAVAAIVAVVHDILVTAGFYSVFQFRVTPATVTAFLTILGFSLYDTVVVFDKVRENTDDLLETRGASYSEMVNRSLNQVLMRSLSTSVVAVLPVASLLVVGAVWLGATALSDFALALLAGLIVGTYSSLFVATPILAAWKERDPRYIELRQQLADPALQGVDARREAKAAARAAAKDPAEGDSAAQPPTVSARARRQRGRKRR